MPRRPSSKSTNPGQTPGPPKYGTGAGADGSAPGGGDESFDIQISTIGQTFAWVVWKDGAVDRSRYATFYLTWGPSAAAVPATIDDLVIERVDSTGARLIWNPVTEDTSGNPLTACLT